MNRTLFIFNRDCLADNRPVLENEIEVKGCSKTIPVDLPIRSQLIECVLDYCRIIYDILPQEAQLSVSVEATTSKPLHVFNEWEWTQQSFLHISQKIANEADSLLEELPKSIAPIHSTLDQAIQFLTRDLKKVNDGDLRVMYMTQVIHDVDVEYYEQSFCQQLFDQFRSARKRGRVQCNVDIIVPILVEEEGSTAHFTCKTYDFRQKKFHSAFPLDSLKIWYINFDHLWDVMLRQMAQRYHGFVLCNVQGIPMKDTGSKANYDVQLACKGVSIDISQDLTATNSFLNLKWHRAEPRKNMEQYYMTKSVHRVTPLCPYTMPTLCLMKHLASGKPVSLSVESDYNERFGIEVTHLMLQHGTNVYLHVLHPNRMFYPWLTIPRHPSEETANNSKPPYRTLEFDEIVKNHMLRTNVPANAIVAKQDQKGSFRTLDDDIELTAEVRSQIFTLMKHNGFFYEVPQSLERYSRLFPLCADEESMLFCNNGQILYPALYDQIVHPLWEYAVKKTPEQLSDEDTKEVSSLLTKLFQAAQKNETTLLPEIQDHTKRFSAYRKLWSEIRMFLIALGHSDTILTLMDKKWPQFFFDKADPTRGSQEQPRRAKRMVEVQRDRYGNVIFPIPLGALTIHSLGKVIYDRPNYHTDKYIWPVGYKSTRYYTSIKDTNNRCLYTCEIHDGGDSPVFVLTSEDNPDQPIRASSATAAWTVIVKKVNEIKTEEAGKRVFTNVSGPEYYGLAHPTVMKLISELPNAEKCIRPNAPHQPAAKQVVNSKLDADSEEEEPKDQKPPAKAEMVTPAPQEPVSPVSAQPTLLPTTGAASIIQRRQARDKQAEAESEQVKMKMKNTGWKKSSSLLDLKRARFSILDQEVPTLDGRQDGPRGLYAFVHNPKDKESSHAPQQSPPFPQNELPTPSVQQDSLPASQQQQQQQQQRKDDKKQKPTTKRSSKKSNTKKRKAPHGSGSSQPPFKVPKTDNGK